MKKLIVITLLSTVATAQTVFIPPYGNGNQKPLLGSLIDYSNPLTKDLVLVYPFNDVTWTIPTWIGDAHGPWDLEAQEGDVQSFRQGWGTDLDGGSEEYKVQYFERDCTSLVQSTTAPFTLVIAGVNRAAATAELRFYITRGTVSNEWIGAGILDTDLATGRWQKGASNYNSTGTTSIGVNDELVISYSCLALDNRSLYLNGRLEVNDTDTAVAINTSDIGYALGMLDRSIVDTWYPTDAYHVAYWHRGMTADEVRNYSDNVNGIFMSEWDMGAVTAAAGAQMYMIAKAIGGP